MDRMVSPYDGGMTSPQVSSHGVNCKGYMYSIRCKMHEMKRITLTRVKSIWWWKSMMVNILTPSCTLHFLCHPSYVPLDIKRVVYPMTHEEWKSWPEWQHTVDSTCLWTKNERTMRDISGSDGIDWESLTDHRQYWIMVLDKKKTFLLMYICMKVPSVCNSFIFPRLSEP